MPLLDPKVPLNLLKIQRWFASIITRPINSDSEMLPNAPSGSPLSEEAKEYITPSLTLSSDQRIQIYNQQYWWRLLSILHENFPALTRLFGHFYFNQSIGIPYLDHNPSKHWSLTKLGDGLFPWLQRHYHEKDRTLVLSAAKMDWAYQESFFAPPATELLPHGALLKKKMKLQPHVQLFELPFDFFSFRTELLKQDVEFWTEADFPPLPKGRKYFFVLYRNAHNALSYQEIAEGEWLLLQSIAGGLTIEEACDSIEKVGGAVYNQSKQSIVNWIQKWIREKWIQTKKKHV